MVFRQPKLITKIGDELTFNPLFFYMDRREYIAKLSSDIGKIILIAFVFGQIIMVKEKGIQYDLLIISLITSIILFISGYFFIKKRS